MPLHPNTSAADPGRLILQFRKAFEEYCSVLCFFAEKILQDKTTAEDVVEETFLKLWDKEPDFSKYKNIKALLYISVKHACIDHLRKERKQMRGRKELTYLHRDENEDFILNAITRAEVLREVYTEMQKLPPECRKVMHHYFADGWDHNKIARHLDISVSTVRNQKARGIHFLKTKLGTSSLILCLFFPPF
jgi:RNA polymerase sigma-70 factor (ECF subfamily)